MNLNLAQILGRITKDPEIRKLPNGTTIANFGIATNRTWMEKDGNKKEEVEFHNIVIFGKLAEIVDKYVKKGQLIYVSGRIITRSWESNGVKKWRTEIIADQMQMGPKPATSMPTTSTEKLDDGSPLPEPEGDIDPEDVPF